MTKISYESLPATVVERCPGLRTLAGDEISWWGEDTVPAHVLFGDVVEPYLESAVESGDQEGARCVLDLVEDMASHEDPRVVDVVRVSVLEALVSKPALLEQVRRSLGVSTTALLRDVEEWEPQSDSTGAP